MNSLNEVACNLLELKITVALLPKCRSGGTTATLTEVSAMSACLLPLSVLLDVAPTSALRAARQAPQQAQPRPLSAGIFSPLTPLLRFCCNVQDAVMIWVMFFFCL